MLWYIGKDSLEYNVRCVCVQCDVTEFTVNNVVQQCGGEESLLYAILP
jgi:hypothetical protein